MGTQDAYPVPRLSLWLHVRRYAVPAPVIETATARRLAGDWVGACAAAGLDTTFTPRSLARTHGWALAGRVRDDVRRLAPDLLRWHMPRVAPDGLLRPGLTVPLARYAHGDGPGVTLVARTPPAWAGGGQRITLALWDGARDLTRTDRAARHPHPAPSRRFRLDLHRHLWDAGRAHELPSRTDPGAGLGPAAGRWAAEAALLLRAEGRTPGAVAVRLGRERLVLEVDPAGGCTARAAGRRDVRALPVLPDAAAWGLPDLALLAAGLVAPDELHPLVAAALVPGHAPPARRTAPAGGPLYVECRGARHRLSHVGGVLTPLDHDPDELRREELLADLTGTPLPCVRAVRDAHTRPEELPEVRARLDHGDAAGAFAAVEALLGPAAVLGEGGLRDVLEAAAARRVDHGRYRSGLAEPGPAPRARRVPGLTHPAGPHQGGRGDHRSHPRQALTAR